MLPITSFTLLPLQKTASIILPFPLSLQCKECGRGFSVRYNLLMHIQTIHSTPQKYRCPISECKEAFHTQPRLNGHLRKVHKTDLKEL